MIALDASNGRGNRWALDKTLTISTLPFSLTTERRREHRTGGGALAGGWLRRWR